MIIIGEKINGTIPLVKEAIANRDAAFIADRVECYHKSAVPNCKEMR